jgi:hypothetical protein
MARLRCVLRISSAVILAFSLVHSSVCGAAVAGFATVVSANHAHVGRAAASVGTTIFVGDSLDTERLGSLQVRAGAARLLLSGASRVTWGVDQDTPAATLTAGTATFSTANAKAFALRVGDAVIRPSGTEASIGSVAVLNPKELTIHCTRGALTLTVVDDALEIPEGTAYHIILDPNAEPAPTDNPKAWNGNQRPKKSGRNRFIFFLILAGGGIAAFAVYKALESPDRP